MRTSCRLLITSPSEFCLVAIIYWSIYILVHIPVHGTYTGTWAPKGEYNIYICILYILSGISTREKVAPAALVVLSFCFPSEYDSLCVVEGAALLLNVTYSRSGKSRCGSGLGLVCPTVIVTPFGRTVSRHDFTTRKIVGRCC